MCVHSFEFVWFERKPVFKAFAVHDTVHTAGLLISGHDSHTAKCSLSSSRLALRAAAYAASPAFRRQKAIICSSPIIRQNRIRNSSLGSIRV